VLRLLSELQEEVRSLRACVREVLQDEVRSLRARVRELEAPATAADLEDPPRITSREVAPSAVPIDAALARRHFLTRASAVAAGVAAAATVGGIARPEVAGAADGNNLVIGAVNTATTRTVIPTTGALEYGFGVHEAGLASFFYSAAIAGHAKDF